MARCPFAKQMPITGSVGAYVGGPFRIVHHTTEGTSAQGAFAAFKKNRSDPHFTVDSTTIYQHIDTGVAARSLRNLKGGCETNRLSSLQIEIVGTAGKPKQRATLENVARLCRWLERTHNVPSQWPSGPPRPAVNGRDPGGHNRNAQIWLTRGGHYGHSHVPENSHWDPAYSAGEAEFVLRYDPDTPSGLQDPELQELRESLPENVPLTPDDIAIPDHGEVGETELDFEDVAPDASSERRGPWAPLAAALATGTAVLLGAWFWRGKRRRPDRG